MKHIIALVVENKPGVLSRVSGLFSRRGFNIESLAVGVTEDPLFSRITIEVRGDEDQIEQIIKQSYKLIDTLKVLDLDPEKAIERELVLIKVSSGVATRSEIMQITDIFRARIVHVAEKSMVIEATGEEAKINAIIDLLKKFGIKEIVRTGKIALERGAE